MPRFYEQTAAAQTCQCGQCGCTRLGPYSQYNTQRVVHQWAPTLGEQMGAKNPMSELAEAINRLCDLIDGGTQV